MASEARGYEQRAFTHRPSEAEWHQTYRRQAADPESVVTEHVLSLLEEQVDGLLEGVRAVAWNNNDTEMIDAQVREIQSLRQQYEEFDTPWSQDAKYLALETLVKALSIAIKAHAENENSDKVKQYSGDMRELTDDILTYYRDAANGNCA